MTEKEILLPRKEEVTQAFTEYWTSKSYLQLVQHKDEREVIRLIASLGTYFVNAILTKGKDNNIEIKDMIEYSTGDRSKDYLLSFAIHAIMELIKISSAMEERHVK